MEASPPPPAGTRRQRPRPTRNRNPIRQNSGRDLEGLTVIYPVVEENTASVCKFWRVWRVLGGIGNSLAWPPRLEPAVEQRRRRLVGSTEAAPVTSAPTQTHAQQPDSRPRSELSDHCQTRAPTLIPTFQPWKVVRKYSISGEECVQSPCEVH